ncbi:MAG: PH domain-containing protein [Oscillospiraceae bacterium]|nr:PH domain-containing protein [Oscillospiraceae bacterium]MDE7278366.1 PH domain-containing protein [Oscillospiraceae bacterium]
MKKYYADRKSLKFLRVFTFLLIICIIIALKYLLYFLEARYPDYFALAKITIPEIIIWIFIGLLVTAYVVFLMIILPLWYRSVSYALSSDEIVMRSGVFFSNTVYVKMSSIQYTTTVSMPLSKYTSFNFLLINAYGGRLVMMFLSHSDMEEIHKKIRTYLSSRGGL